MAQNANTSAGQGGVRQLRGKATVMPRAKNPSSLTAPGIKTVVTTGSAPRTKASDNKKVNSANFGRIGGIR